jgi:hypothetical protein
MGFVLQILKGRSKDLIAQLVLFVLFFGTVALLIWCFTRAVKNETKSEYGAITNVYEGDLDWWAVEINERVDFLMVHLTPTSIKPEGAQWPLYITGHDYGPDGTWDEIFLVFAEGDGFNSVVVEYDDDNAVESWRYTPCRADEDNKDIEAQFTRAAILSAIGLLDGAMRKNYDPKQIVMSYRPYRNLLEKRLEAVDARSR